MELGQQRTSLIVLTSTAQAARVQVQRYLHFDPMCFNDSRKRRDITRLGRPARIPMEGNSERGSSGQVLPATRQANFHNAADAVIPRLKKGFCPAGDHRSCQSRCCAVFCAPLRKSWMIRFPSAPLIHIPLRCRLCGAPQVKKKGTPKREAAENFEFESWPQESRFGSWKVSLFREVLSRSMRPQLVGEWSAETDYATSMDDLDHSGFVLGNFTIRI